MREVKLASGAVLKITPAPFSVAKALYQALLRELRGVAFTADTDMAVLYRDFFCLGFSSLEVEKCLWECFKRCTYDCGQGDLRISEDSFEPVECREDYMQVCMEVGKENVLPFGKSLYAEYERARQGGAATPT